MLEIISTSFMQKAFFVGIIISLLSGIISVFVVLRKMSFIGAGISHSAFGGVAIGFLTGIDPIITAVIYCIAVALGIENISTKGKVSEDAAIGVFFAGSMALGIVLLSISKDYAVDLFGYLFGNILAITENEIIISSIVSISVILTIFLFLKELFMITYSEEIAKVSGIPVRVINTIFLISLAISIVISMKVVGIILISALLVIPGATAKLFAKSLFFMITMSCAVSVFSTVTGLIVAYYLDTAPGGTIVLVLTFLFLLGLIIQKKQFKKLSGLQTGMFMSL